MAGPESNSPRPELKTSTSRPALRIRRLQHQENQDEDTLDRQLLPGEVAGIVRDVRGNATLAAVPETVIAHQSRQNNEGERNAIHPTPSNTVPVPGDASRPSPVLATEDPESGGHKRSARWWWPFGKGKKDRSGADDEGGSGRFRIRSGAPANVESSLQLHGQDRDHYAEDIVDWLDVMDPEVATVSTLSNVQNSLFLPDMGAVYNRLPIINLSTRPKGKERQRQKGKKTRQRSPGGRSFATGSVSAFAEPTAEAKEAERVARLALATPRSEHGEVREPEPTSDTQAQPSRRLHNPVTSSPLAQQQRTPPLSRRSSVSSVSSTSTTSSSSSSGAPRRRRTHSSSPARGEYAILPAGIAWDGWTSTERLALDDHVRHLMHSKREKLRRRLRGFVKFVSRPVGALITIYAFLITFWGTAWVLFLIGWIYLGNRKAYFIEIAEQVLTALFCVVGIGMSPFRAVDTYHMIYIAHYHRLTLKLRKKMNLPRLSDVNDLPAPEALDPDLEAQFKKAEVPVLTPEQQEKLVYHQMKYHKSHTFYRPHETATHHAFPVDLMIVITCLLDCHSMFQMALGGTTWGINYHVRPAALTATILSCSISCNITAGILIAVGGRRSRKTEEVERRARQALTEEAMRRIEKKKRRREALEAGGAKEKETHKRDAVKDRLEMVTSFGRDKERRSSDERPLSQAQTLPRRSDSGRSTLAADETIHESTKEVGKEGVKTEQQGFRCSGNGYANSDRPQKRI